MRTELGKRPLLHVLPLQLTRTRPRSHNTAYKQCTVLISLVQFSCSRGLEMWSAGTLSHLLCSLAYLCGGRHALRQHLALRPPGGPMCCCVVKFSSRHLSFFRPYRYYNDRASTLRVARCYVKFFIYLILCNIFVDSTVEWRSCSYVIFLTGCECTIGRSYGTQTYNAGIPIGPVMSLARPSVRCGLRTPKLKCKEKYLCEFSPEHE